MWMPRATVLVVAFLAVPEPFDFALSTERFRAFGVDRANLWHEGGLHRVVGGRELRIEAAPGGVDAQPLDAETEPVVRALLGLVFDLDPFYAWAAEDEVLVTLVPALAGFRPPIIPDPFELLVGAITAQQVSLSPRPRSGTGSSSGSASAPARRGPSRPATGLRGRARTTCSRSG